MFKYAEITMLSGAKYYLITTEETKYTRAKVDYVLAGKSGTSVEVNTTSTLTSDKVFINPGFIESYKLFM